jgi:hypothetical protein
MKKREGRGEKMYEDAVGMHDDKPLPVSSSSPG